MIFSFFCFISMMFEIFSPYDKYNEFLLKVCYVSSYLNELFCWPSLWHKRHSPPKYTFFIAIQNGTTYYWKKNHKQFQETFDSPLALHLSGLEIMAKTPGISQKEKKGQRTNFFNYSVLFVKNASSETHPCLLSLLRV